MQIIKTGKITINDSEVGETITYQLCGCNFINDTLVGIQGKIGFYAEVHDNKITIMQVVRDFYGTGTLSSLTTIPVDMGSDWTHEEVVALEEV